MDIFYPKLSKCEEPIVVIACIIAKKERHKFIEIMNQFYDLGYNTVKDLAQTTSEKFSQMSIDGDLIAKLNEAIRVYDQQCDDKLRTAISEYNQKNFIDSLEICKEIYEFHPTNIIGLHLLASSYFYCEDYDSCIKYLLELSNQKSNCAEVFSNLGLCYIKKSQFKDALNYFYQAVICKPHKIIFRIYFTHALTRVDPPRAINFFEYIMKSNPKLFMLRYNYGRFLLSIHKVDEAKQQFKTINKNVLNFSYSWNSLGDIYCSINKIKKGIICYENVLKIDSSITTWINLGRAYMMLNDYLNAMNSFKAAHKLCPNEFLTLEHLAQTYHYLENPLLAIKIYKRCLELQPNNLDCNLNLGLLYLQCLKNNQKAEKYLKKCLGLNPQTKLEIIYKNLSIVYKEQKKYKNASEVSMLLAEMYFELDNHSDASKAYTYSLIFDPGNSDGHWKLGLTYYKMGFPDLALIRYRKAIELKPDFPDACYDSALIYEEKNLSDAAIRYYEMTLKHQPNHYNALRNLILLKEKLGHLDDLIDLYNIMLDHENSDNLEVYVDLGNVYHKKGNLDEAYSCYLKADDIQNTVETSILIGNVLIEMKKMNEALVYYKRAIQLDPQCYVAYNYIGSIYKDSKNNADAIDMFKMALKIKPYYPDATCNLTQCLQQLEINEN